MADVITDIALKALSGLSKVRLGWFKRKYVESLNHDEVKQRVRILFIDDQWFEVIDTLKNDGWDIEYLSDLKSFSSPELVRAHVVFVDYKGVGKHLSTKDQEGLGLVRGIKKHHQKKQVVLYSAHGQFGLADEVEHQKYADEVIPKDSEPFVFTEKIEKHARIALST